MNTRLTTEERAELRLRWNGSGLGGRLAEQSNDMMAALDSLDSAEKYIVELRDVLDRHVGVQPASRCGMTVIQMMDRIRELEAELAKALKITPVTEAEWDAARAKESEHDTHPCEHYSAQVCFCEGSCSCHWKTNLEMQQVPITKKVETSD